MTLISTGVHTAIARRVERLAESRGYVADLDFVCEHKFIGAELFIEMSYPFPEDLFNKLNAKEQISVEVFIDDENFNKNIAARVIYLPEVQGFIPQQQSAANQLEAMIKALQQANVKYSTTGDIVEIKAMTAKELNSMFSDKFKNKQEKEEEDNSISHYYILNAQKQPLKTIADIAHKWLSIDGNKITAKEQIGGIEVSTVFLGLDHNFSGKGPPVLWETMIFGILNEEGEDENNYCERYTSHADALDGHARAVAWVMELSKDQPKALPAPPRTITIDSLD